MRGWVWFNGPHPRRLQRIKAVFVGTVQMESFGMGARWFGLQGGDWTRD